MRFLNDCYLITVGPSLITEASFVELPTLIAIVVSCIVAGLFAVLLLMFCRCKRKQSKESAKAKEYDIDSIHPSIVAQQNQAPPPYYSASSLENKALEHSMDLAMDQNTALYASQQTYGYHQQNTMMPQVQQNDCKCPISTSLCLDSQFTIVHYSSQGPTWVTWRTRTPTRTTAEA